ncbi:MAG: YHS domain-containing protein [Cyclobacteriaceae bacterium]|nr:YHS domain-containing protein [Cyclobacteriaceae bacterium]
MINLRIIALSVLILFVGQVYAQDISAKRKKEFNIENDLAIQGYDPVGYFTTGKALEGKKELSFSYQGVTYYFSSAANKELFKTTPEKYEPVYGGWCAYAMGATGEKVEVDPETFKIIDGKLCLYYNKLFTNTLKTWNRDEKSLKEKADNNWTKFFKK